MLNTTIQTHTPAFQRDYFSFTSYLRHADFNVMVKDAYGRNCMWVYVTVVPTKKDKNGRKYCEKMNWSCRLINPTPQEINNLRVYLRNQCNVRLTVRVDCKPVSDSDLTAVPMADIGKLELCPYATEPITLYESQAYREYCHKHGDQAQPSLF